MVVTPQSTNSSLLSLTVLIILLLSLLAVRCTRPKAPPSGNTCPMTMTTSDPTAEDYDCITAAFEASLSSPCVLLDDISLPADGGARITAGIRAGTTSAVSDGSFDSTIQVGTSSFTMAATQEPDEERLYSSNYVTDMAADQSAHRSELAGVIGALATVTAIVKKNDITSGSITIALDGESALWEAKGDWPLQFDQPDFDCFQEIRNRVAALPITVNWRWVKGHQKERKFAA